MIENLLQIWRSVNIALWYRLSVESPTREKAIQRMKRALHDSIRTSSLTRKYNMPNFTVNTYFKFLIVSCLFISFLFCTRIHTTIDYLKLIFEFEVVIWITICWHFFCCFHIIGCSSTCNTFTHFWDVCSCLSIAGIGKREDK